MPVLWVEINDRLGNAKFNLPSIIIYSITSSSIVISKHTHKNRTKKTNLFRWITEGGDFNNNYTVKVEIVIPESDVKKSVTWSFHVDDSQGNHR